MLVGVPWMRSTSSACDPRVKTVVSVTFAPVRGDSSLRPGVFVGRCLAIVVLLLRALDGSSGPGALLLPRWEVRPLSGGRGAGRAVTAPRDWSTASVLGMVVTGWAASSEMTLPVRGETIVDMPAIATTTNPAVTPAMVQGLRPVRICSSSLLHQSLDSAGSLSRRKCSARSR